MLCVVCFVDCPFGLLTRCYPSYLRVAAECNGSPCRPLHVSQRENKNDPCRELAGCVVRHVLCRCLLAVVLTVLVFAGLQLALATIGLFLLMFIMTLLAFFFMWPAAVSAAWSFLLAAAVPSVSITLILSLMQVCGCGCVWVCLRTVVRLSVCVNTAHASMLAAHRFGLPVDGQRERYPASSAVPNR